VKDPCQLEAKKQHMESDEEEELLSCTIEPSWQKNKKMQEKDEEPECPQQKKPTTSKRKQRQDPQPAEVESVDPVVT